MAAALTLGLRGHHVIVLEAAPKVRDTEGCGPEITNTLQKLMEVGAGIQVSPNMLRLFDRAPCFL